MKHLAWLSTARKGSRMRATQDHRRCAEECVAMARAADDDNGKVLWLTLALSWVRLAEHVARTTDGLERSDADGDDGIVRSADQV